MIRDGASKMLQLSKAPRQNIELSKSLFVSNMKTLALLKQLQQAKRGQKDTTEHIRYYTVHAYNPPTHLIKDDYMPWVAFHPRA